MSNDIPESVSQRGYGAYDEENRKIREISDELQRLCRLHEAQPRTGQADGKQEAVSAMPSELEHCRVATSEDQRSNRFEIEQRTTEQYAKENSLWIPMSDIYVIDAEIKKV